MSSILSAQNLQTLRRRNIGRRWPCCLSPPFLSPPRPPRPPRPPDRPCPNGMLHLRSVETVVVHAVRLFLASFARLPLRRQAALDAPAFGIRLPLRARALHDLLLFVNADHEVAHHLVDHFQAAIELLHELARTVDDFE